MGVTSAVLGLGTLANTQVANADIATDSADQTSQSAEQNSALSDTTTVLAGNKSTSQQNDTQQNGTSNQTPTVTTVSSTTPAATPAPASTNNTSSTSADTTSEAATPTTPATNQSGDVAENTTITPDSSSTEATDTDFQTTVNYVDKDTQQTIAIPNVTSSTGEFSSKQLKDSVQTNLDYLASLGYVVDDTYDNTYDLAVQKFGIEGLTLDQAKKDLIGEMTKLQVAYNDTDPQLDAILTVVDGKTTGSDLLTSFTKTSQQTDDRLNPSLDDNALIFKVAVAVPDDLTIQDWANQLIHMTSVQADLLVLKMNSYDAYEWIDAAYDYNVSNVPAGTPVNLYPDETGKLDWPGIGLANFSGSGQGTSAHLISLLSAPDKDYPIYLTNNGVDNDVTYINFDTGDTVATDTVSGQYGTPVTFTIPEGYHLASGDELKNGETQPDENATIQANGYQFNVYVARTEGQLDNGIQTKTVTKTGDALFVTADEYYDNLTPTTDATTTGITTTNPSKTGTTNASTDHPTSTTTNDTTTTPTTDHQVDTSTSNTTANGTRTEQVDLNDGTSTAESQSITEPDAQQTTEKTVGENNSAVVNNTINTGATDTMVRITSPITTAENTKNQLPQTSERDGSLLALAGVGLLGLLGLLGVNGMKKRS